MLLFIVVLFGCIASKNSTEIDVEKITVDKVFFYNTPIDIKLTLKSNSLTPIKYNLYDNNQNIKSGILQPSMSNEASHDIENTQSLQGSFLKVYVIDGIPLKNIVYHNMKLEISPQNTVDNNVVTEHFFVTGIPGWVSLLPTLILIITAIVSNQAIIALGVGLFVSATLVNGVNPFYGFLRSIDYYMIYALLDKSNIQVTIFTFLLSGLIGMIQRSGGALGLSKKICQFAKDRCSVQLCTFILGMIVFIDDFASCLIVGLNMRPITDLMYVSREKLAFLVHATSSPPASISPISSWIGFELNLIEIQLKKLNIDKKPLIVFLETLPYRFFPILMLVFVLAIILLKKDFGPMLRAERKAYKEQTLTITETDDDINETQTKEKDDAKYTMVDNPMDPLSTTPARWFNAIIPILIIIITTIVSIFVTGYYDLLDKKQKGNNVELSALNIAGSGDAYSSLLYSCTLAFTVSWLMFKVQKIMSFTEGISVFVKGVESVVEPFLILILSWSIGIVYADLKCATYIISIASSYVSGESLPSLVFVLSCVLSFSTGTSWGTMTVMFPLVVPLANSISKDNNVLVGSVASILTGAIFGDQCSPISGTSVLCAISCKLSVKDHVITQLPYAILVALTSLLLGYVPVGYNAYPTYVGIITSSAFLIIFIFFAGSKVEDDSIDKFTKVYNSVRSIFHRNKTVKTCDTNTASDVEKQ